MENVSKSYDIEELPETMFPVIFDLIDQYQQKEPCLTAKITRAKY